VTCQPVEDELVTRGYACGTNDPKRFLVTSTQMSTWSPSIIVDAVYDGVHESRDIAEIQKDRTRYYQPFTAPPYDVENVNDDHSTPWRQDYSVSLTGDQEIECNSGWDPNLEQKTTERVGTHGFGKYMQLRFRGSDGRSTIENVTVTGRPGTTRRGTHAGAQ
jgi:hypothetical protein